MLSSRKRWPSHACSSRFIAGWDGVTAIALLFVTVITPVEVGFLEPAGSWWDPLFLVNQGVNLVFVADCVLQFFLMVQITDKNGTRYVSDPVLIANQYMRTWLPVDLLSIAVAAVDYIGISSVSNPEGTGERESDVDSLRGLRVLRALRLVKLSKLISGQRLIKRYETRVAINYAAISLLRCLFGMMMLSHWMACIWGLQTNFSASKMDTWLAGSSNLCEYGTNQTIICLGPEYLEGREQGVEGLTRRQRVHGFEQRVERGVTQRVLLLDDVAEGQVARFGRHQDRTHHVHVRVLRGEVERGGAAPVARGGELLGGRGLEHGHEGAAELGSDVEGRREA